MKAPKGQAAKSHDPSHTGFILRPWLAESKRRFAKLRLDVRNEVKLFYQSVPKANAQYAFTTAPEKLERFKTWLSLQMHNGLLDVKDGNPANVYKGHWWAGKYITSAYKKGMTRAVDEMKKAGLPGYINIRPIPTVAPALFGTADYEQGLTLKREFPNVKLPEPGKMTADLLARFNSPVHAERVALLYGRAFEGMKGITDAMSNSLSGILAQGMVDGRNPYEIAKDINKTLDIGEARSKVIARTEIIRAHHVGSVITYKEAGVMGVKTMAEWVTVSGDVGNFEEMGVCPLCQALQEQTRKKPMSLDEILPLLPRHPNCRCVAIPVITDIEG